MSLKFRNEEGRKVFLLRCRIREFEETKSQIKNLVQQINSHNEQSEYWTERYNKTEKECEQQSYQTRIINCTGKLRLLNRQRRTLQEQLNPKPPEHDEAPSIAFLSQEAEKELVEMGIF